MYSNMHKLLKNSMRLLIRIRNDKRRKYRSRWGIVFLCNKLGNSLSLGQSEKGSESQLHSGLGGFVYSV